MEGKAKKFEELFITYSDAIFRHLQYRLGHRERAKELTQEVFMRTWKYLSSNKSIEYERAFLYTIANNLFINEIRSKQETVPLEVAGEKELTDNDRLSTPDHYSEEQELMRFISQLSDSYREVLILRYIDDFAVKDIASLLGEKETNISMRIARATEKLKQIYQKE